MDEAVSELKNSEERAKKASADAARLADELRHEQVKLFRKKLIENKLMNSKIYNRNMLYQSIDLEKDSNNKLKIYKLDWMKPK